MKLDRYLFHGLRAVAVIAIAIGMTRMATAASGTNGCSMSVRRIKGPPPGANYLNAACNTGGGCNGGTGTCSAVFSTSHPTYFTCQCSDGLSSGYCLVGFEEATDPPEVVHIDSQPYVGGTGLCINLSCAANCPPANNVCSDSVPQTSPATEELSCPCPNGQP